MNANRSNLEAPGLRAWDFLGCCICISGVCKKRRFLNSSHSRCWETHRTKGHHRGHSPNMRGARVPCLPCSPTSDYGNERADQGPDRTALMCRGSETWPPGKLFPCPCWPDCPKPLWPGPLVTAPEEAVRAVPSHTPGAPGGLPLGKPLGHPAPDAPPQPSLVPRHRAGPQQASPSLRPSLSTWHLLSLTQAGFSTDRVSGTAFPALLSLQAQPGGQMPFASAQPCRPNGVSCFPLTWGPPSLTQSHLY